MNRYYFFKRNSNIRKELKGDLIDFSLSALYSTKEYSLKNKKEISQFHYFDEMHACISTKTPGIYQVSFDSGTDGCHGHYATSVKELKNCFSEQCYSCISERDYFRLRKLAIKLIFKHIKFFNQDNEDAERKHFYQTSWSKAFYDIKLVSTSERYNIQNYPESQLKSFKEDEIKLNNLRIDEDFRIFISKDKKYKSNKFQIESKHFNPYYENYQGFMSSNFLRKDKKTIEVQDFQFNRLKKMVTALILDRIHLDISSILPAQTSLITILDN